MREAIGNTFIVNLVLIFLAILIALLLGSVSYSKAYKVKNRIIYTLEKYNYSADDWNDQSKKSVVINEIASSLKSIGYSMNVYNHECKKENDKGVIKKIYPTSVSEKSSYHYCIYMYNAEGMGPYYGVTTFMHFDIPLIGGFLEFPVYGETKVMYDTKVEIKY